VSQDGEPNLDLAVLRALQRVPGGRTTRQISTRLRNPPHLVAESLARLHEKGKVRLRDGSRWHATGPVQLGWTPSDSLQVGPTVDRTGSQPRSGQTGAEGERKSDSPLAAKSRWGDFRNLCQYYAECIRLESRADVTARAGDEGAKFLSLRGQFDWRGISAGRQLALQPSEDWSAFVRYVKRQRSRPRLFLGTPVDLFLWQRQQTDETIRFVSPLFVVQVEHRLRDGMLYLQPTGPVEVNHGWLHRRWRNRKDRDAFLELCGIETPDGYAEDEEAAHDAQPGFPELVSAFWQHFRDLWQETANLDRLNCDPPLAASERSGIYNRAVLVPQPELKYTARLYGELNRLAQDATDEQLDRCALTVLFPHEPPRPASPESVSSQSQGEPAAGAEIDDTVEIHSLNDEQRRACQVARESPFSVVIGPPGTGKSRVVANTVADAVIRGKSVLFASRNHQALEAVVPRLNAVTEPNQTILRISRPSGDVGADPLVAMLDTIFDQPIPHGVQEDFAAGIERLTRLLKEMADNRDCIRRIHDIHTEMEYAERDLGDLLRDFPDSYEAIVWQLPVLPETDEVGRVLDVLDADATQPQSWFARLWRRLLRFWRRRKAFPLAAGIDQQFCSVFGGALRVTERRDTAAEEEMIRRLRQWRRLAEAVSTAHHITDLHDAVSCMPSLGDCYDRHDAFASRVCEETQVCLKQRMWVTAAELTGEDREKLAEIRSGLENYYGRLETAWSPEFRRAARKAHSVLLRYLPAWATTNLRAGNLPWVAAAFDLLIVDEATQCDIASVIPLLFRTRRAMAVGDPMQLKHVSTLKGEVDLRLRKRFGLTDVKWERFTYRTNSFLQLADGAASVSPDDKVRLQDHHRSHPRIAGYCNDTFYTGSLRIMTRQEDLKVPRGFDVHRGGFRWTHVPADAEAAGGGGAISHGQIEAIVEELQRLLDEGFPGTVGVVTPFKAQKYRINDRVSEVFTGSLPAHWRFLVDTADGYQGDERDVMLLSLVGGPDMPRGSRWFLANSPNRFNVAVSRARAALHVFGDEEWARDCAIPHIVNLWNAVQSQQQMEPETLRTDLIGPVWEPRFAQALRAEDLPFKQQYPACGRYLDFALIREGLKLDVEVDGEAYHRGLDGRRKVEDLVRDFVLIANGWKVLRFWVYELREDMASCVDKVKRIWFGEPEPQTERDDNGRNENGRSGGVSDG